MNKKIRGLAHVLCVCPAHPLKGCSGKAVFHPTIKTVGFQSAITVMLNTKTAISLIICMLVLNACQLQKSEQTMRATKIEQKDTPIDQKDTRSLQSAATPCGETSVEIRQELNDFLSLAEKHFASKPINQIFTNNSHAQLQVESIC